MCGYCEFFSLLPWEKRNFRSPPLWQTTKRRSGTEKKYEKGKEALSLAKLLLPSCIISLLLPGKIWKETGGERRKEQVQGKCIPRTLRSREQAYLSAYQFVFSLLMNIFLVLLRVVLYLPLRWDLLSCMYLWAFWLLQKGDASLGDKTLFIVPAYL